MELYALALLACPVGMGLMMWMMMRGNQQQPPPRTENAADADELARLRSEVDRLHAERAGSLNGHDSLTERRGTGRGDPTPAGMSRP